jgi:excisionase family DNA binding protein
MITSVSPTPKVELPPLLKTREVAKLLSLSRGTVRSLIDSGDLAAHAINPTRKRRTKRVHVRITSESLLGFYKKRFGEELQHTSRNLFSK